MTSPPGGGWEVFGAHDIVDIHPESLGARLPVGLPRVDDGGEEGLAEPAGGTGSLIESRHRSRRACTRPSRFSARWAAWT